MYLLFKHGHPIITTNELTLGEIREMFFPTRQKYKNTKIMKLKKKFGTAFLRCCTAKGLVQGSNTNIYILG